MQGLARLNGQPARQSVRGMLPVPTDARLLGGHELLSGLFQASFKSSSSLADNARNAVTSKASR